MMCKDHVWIDGHRVFEARPVDSVENDSGERPDNKKIKWVIFQVFCDGKSINYDGVGYAESIKAAKKGIYIF